METSYDDTGSSSSLPPLSETFLTFDQTPLSLEGFEQVPCFSNATPAAALPHLPQVEEGPPLPTKAFPPDLGSIPDLGSFFSPLISSEKKVIKAVLDHFSKLESSQKMMELPAASLDDHGGYPSEDCLSDMGVGVSSLWSHF